ncbi:unnamed protein product [Amoebophrya sp. A120]|nr:unnamed protein product [Amoebophrya sp. A120]|eukprot:GSA120T00002309001.1
MTSLQTIEAFFPQQAFGCIIGPRGERINAIKDNNDVRITNDAKDQLKDGGFRRITIAGEWVHMWCAFCDLIKSVQQDDKFQVDHPDLFEKFAVQMRIPVGCAGALIGRGGANLNGWREKWPDCKFELKHEDTDNVYRYFHLIGPSPDLCEAAVSIADVLEAALMNAQPGGGNKKNANGPGNNNSTQQNKRGRQREQASSKEADPPQYSAFTSGNEPANPFAPSMSDNQDKRRRVDGPTSNGAAGGGVSTVAEMECVCTIHVGENTIGRIIGEKGTSIKQIRASSQCAITTDKKGDRDDGMREVQVRGFVPHVSTALMMINTLLSVPSDK